MDIIFSKQEHKVWQILITQQMKMVQTIACAEYLEGLKILNFTTKKIPKVKSVSFKLYDASEWTLVPVNSLISVKPYFNMLANKQFPIMNVIRSSKEIDFYTNEAPDIFHDFFGHCPFIINKKYAEYIYKFAKYAIKCDEKLMLALAKIYWITFEFGLIENNNKIQILGAGILPSKSEINRIVNNININKIRLNTKTKIKASLKGNIAQSLYYTVNSLEELYDIIDNDLETLAQINLAI